MSISPCIPDTDATARELETHGSSGFPLACYHDDLQVQPVPWHWHEEIEILLVSEGSITACAGARRYLLNRGEGLFINVGVLHADTPAAPGACRLHSVVFHPRLVGGMADSVFWQKYLRPLLADPARPCIPLRPDVGWQGTALDALETAWQSMREEPPGYEFTIRAALSQIILLLHENSSAGQPLPRKAVRSTTRMKTMLQFIQQHYAEDIALEEIAAAAAISPSECLRCFRRMIGDAPVRYLCGYRAQRAAELLYSTSAPVIDIAMQCGFKDASYFARVFRQQYGCSPTEYRAKK